MTVDPVGGVWTYALALARGLVQRGGAVALACMGGPLTPAQYRAVQEIPGVDLFTSQYRLEWMDDPWGDVDLAGEWLLELAQDWGPDVIHLNGFAHGSLAWSQPVLVVAHSCVLSWWAAVRGDRVPDKYSEYQRRVRAGLEAARWIVAPTRAMLDALYAHYGQTGLQSVVFNGAETPEPATGERDEVVLSVGRLWDRAKNTELLANIASRLPWRVALAGETQSPAGLGTRWSHVKLLGQLDRGALAAQYASAGIFAAPALYEPFGLSVLEAAQHGCPLVLGDIESLRELWEGAAVFVDPRSPEAWTRVLRQLIGDPERRSWLSEAARARSLRYNVDAMVDRYCSIYDYLTLPQHARPISPP
ncbi:MAG: glycosyltransferase family 4 protein [Vicinamibacteria bacterium]